MTVQEVIEALQKCDPKAQVVVGSQGYGHSSSTGMFEMGVDEKEDIEVNDLETKVVIQPTGIS